MSKTRMRTNTPPKSRQRGKITDGVLSGAGEGYFSAICPKGHAGGATITMDMDKRPMAAPTTGRENYVAGRFRRRTRPLRTGCWTRFMATNRGDGKIHEQGWYVAGTTLGRGRFAGGKDEARRPDRISHAAMLGPRGICQSVEVGGVNVSMPALTNTPKVVHVLLNFGTERLGGAERAGVGLVAFCLWFHWD